MRPPWSCLLLVLLLAPVAQGAPWAQTSHDAARTGHTDDAGPATNDTAFVARLPGVPAEGALGPPEPIIHDGFVYLPVRPSGFDDGLDGQGIARVELATGESELFVEMDTPRSTLQAAMASSSCPVAVGWTPTRSGPGSRPGAWSTRG